MNKVIVAFSAGIDSTLLLKIATDVLGSDCIGVMGISPSVGRAEIAESKKIAQITGARIEYIDTREMENENYLRNDKKRCFYCKQELYSKLTVLSAQFDVEYIIDGNNLDDISDYRPGRTAGTQQGIRSPFIECRIDKSEIRLLARYLQLPVWDKPEQPCLASRVAYGNPIDSRILKQIDAAENILKEKGFRVIRVRYMGDHFSVEVGKDELKRLFTRDMTDELRSRLHGLGLFHITFDPSGYEKGRLNQYNT